MGLKDWVDAVKNEPDIVWIPGVFQITEASFPAFGASMVDGWWTGLLIAPGMDPTPLVHTGMAPVDKWPAPGQVLPVTVVPTDTSLLKINWDTIPTRQDTGLAAAQALAAQHTSTPAGPGSAPT